MTTTVTIENGKIFLNGLDLESLLEKVYQKGRTDSSQADKSDRVTFVKLSQELKEAGRNISVVTLTKRAREAKVKVFQFDGKRLACKRSDVRNFVDLPFEK